MIKNNKIKIIIASALTLLPMLIGFILWNKLPENMTVHWGAEGNPDASAGKLFAVIGLPLILFLLYWVCIAVTAMDKKNRTQNNKVFGMVIWIMPVLSLAVNGIVYMCALGKDISFSIVSVLIGCMFIFIGNYMPKCTRNNTIGIKIKYTLQSEENWNATHRFAGKVWFVGGFILLLTAFLPEMTGVYAMMVLIVPVVLLPMIYSYSYYKKQQKQGVAFESISRSTKSLTAKLLTLVLVAAILIFTAIIMFTGDIEIIYNEDSFTVEADYYDDMTVRYDEIDSMEYREELDKGVRKLGFGSPRLSMGIFKNSEFGDYTIYAYTGVAEGIVIRSGDYVLVINGKDTKDTEMIYNKLSEVVK